MLPDSDVWPASRHGAAGITNRRRSLEASADSLGIVHGVPQPGIPEIGVSDAIDLLHKDLERSEERIPPFFFPVMGITLS
jgi:hypothetical protein